MSEGFEKFLLQGMKIHGCGFTPCDNIQIN
jgi:hypothetical protein